MASALKRPLSDEPLDEPTAPKRFKAWGGVLAILESECAATDDVATIVETNYSRAAALMCELGQCATLTQVMQVLDNTRFEYEGVLVPGIGPRIKTWWNSVGSKRLEEIVRSYVPDAGLGPRKFELLYNAVTHGYKDAFAFLFPLEIAERDSPLNTYNRWNILVQIARYLPADCFPKPLQTFLHPDRFDPDLSFSQLVRAANCYETCQYLSEVWSKGEYPGSGPAWPSLSLHCIQRGVVTPFVLRLVVETGEAPYRVLAETSSWANREPCFTSIVKHGASVGMDVELYASLFLDREVGLGQIGQVRMFTVIGRDLTFRDFRYRTFPLGVDYSWYLDALLNVPNLATFQDETVQRLVFADIAMVHTAQRASLLDRFFQRYPVPLNPIQLLIDSLNHHGVIIDQCEVINVLCSKMGYRVTQQDLDDAATRLPYLRLWRHLRRKYRGQQRAATAAVSTAATLLVEEATGAEQREAPASAASR